MLASMVWLILINVNFIVIWHRFVFVLFYSILVFIYEFIYLFIIIISPKFKLFCFKSFARHDPIECNLIIVTTLLV